MLIEITYNVTDVYMSTTETPVYVEISFEQPGSASAVWGSITGTLSNQTDLQNALNAKFDDPTGTTLQYIDGTGALQTFPLTLPVLQEVRNQTGATLDAGTVVYINGATGNKPTVTKAIATGDATSAQTLGMISAAIANNGVGYVVVIGTCGGLDTSAYTEGQQLYLSGTVAGGVTTTKPYAPIHLVYVGIVTRAHPNLGTIEVRVQNGYEMDEIHNVSAQTPSNNDGLFYNTSTSLWESKSITTALGYTPVPTTRNITINGVTYDLSADRTYTISTGISGSGASGQVTYWTGASAVSGSNNLFWDNTNSRLGIGTNAPANPLQINYSNNTYLSGIFINNTNTGTTTLSGVTLTVNGVAGGGFLYQPSNYINASQASALIMASGGNNRLGFIANSNQSGVAQDIFFSTFGANTTYQLLIKGNTGNILINSNSDNGQRLQVYGDTLLRGSGNTSATTALTVQNSSSVNLLRVLNDGQINLGSSASFPYIKTIASDFTQTPTGTKVLFGTQDTTTGNGSFLFGSNTLAHTTGTVTYVQLLRDFTPTSGTGSTTHLLLSSIINQTGGANGTTRGLYVNPTLTAAADWRSIEWSNNSGWGLYGVGTANNYLAGNLGIGITPTVRLHVSGDTILKGSGATSATTALTVQNSSSTNLLRVRNDGTSISRGGIFFGTSTNNFIASSNANNLVDVTGFNFNILFGSFDTAGFGVLIGGYNASERTATSGVSGVLNATHGFAPTSGTGTFIGINYTGTINQTGGANGITRGLYVNPTLTAAADWRSIEWSNNTGWGLYGAGTADNYLAGDLGIGTTSVTNWLNIAASTTAKAHINLAAGSTPTAPANGDIWFDGTDIKMRIGGVTKTFTLI